MNKLTTEKRVQILTALCEGCSLRSTSRMAGVSINTVTKLLIEAGLVCAEFQHEHLRGLNSKRLELDEIWSFCYSKQKNVTDEIRAEVEGAGDVWTWTAIDAESKLIVSWHVGNRDGENACHFVCDVAERLNHRVQITSDGLKAYVDAVDLAFGGEVDFAQLHKIYGPAGPFTTKNEARYSPAKCIGCETKVVTGSPDEAKISTSYVERQNLTMRMRMRRFTRLTNAFSKKLENHEHAVALYFFHYNFIRRHQTLRMTPAMKAGVCKHQWSIEELVELIDRTQAYKERKRKEGPTGFYPIPMDQLSSDNNSN
jgi:IS1 family transposase